MPFRPPYHFQWQNPELCKTIYPFREAKLRDFLQTYKEVDLWKAMRSKPVNQQLANEVVQEYARISVATETAKRQKEEAKKQLKDLEEKNRTTLRAREFVILRQRKINHNIKISPIESKINTLERRVDWYQKFAPDHPLHQKWKNDLKEQQAALAEIMKEVDAVEREYQAELAKAGLANFERQREALQQRILDSDERVKKLKEDTLKLPRLGKNGEVSQAIAVRWMVQRYRQELEKLDQQQLLKAIFERFDAEPERFPKWLQYMVVHFSGMRYRSSHGSWAAPKDLLEALRIEEEKNRLEALKDAALGAACDKAVAELESSKKPGLSPTETRRIDLTITRLKNTFQRQRTLIEYRSAQVVEQVNKLTEQQALGQIEARKSMFPDWAWKEIVARTDLRLKTQDENWEELTPEQQKARWSAENSHWRAILDAWEREDITQWRQQHGQTLALIVSRAVCNEIAEHIQHLRGIKPAAGLTSKPTWYLRLQRNASATPPPPGADAPYFRPPKTAVKADFKPGASILWLGWVGRQPNAWQIARPIDGVNLLPDDARTMEVRKGAAREEQSTWNYQVDGGSFVRASRPIKGGGKKNKAAASAQKQWLRWTHEATVIEVVELAGGVQTVLTFETGQIGIRLRPLFELVGRWDVCVGYVPPNPVPPENLDDMLQRSKLLPPSPALPPMAFGLPLEEDAPTEVAAAPLGFDMALAGASGVPKPSPFTSETVDIWESLTPREKQVVALICRMLPTREVAARLEIKKSTINSHLNNAMRKYGVHSRQELRRAVAGER